jgi:3-dehydroquinate synthase
MALPEHIRLSHNPGTDLRLFLARSSFTSIALLTDSHTARFCYPVIQPDLPPHTHITIPAGEAHKTLDTCTQVWQALTDARMDRQSVLIVLGGGMPGDLGGFCAATFKRGIAFILVPTTLLAQADASIGGKLGIDFQSFKNQIGVFAQPALTLLSDVFLQTLPEAELRSGYAEILKHALISDQNWWEALTEKPWKQHHWQGAIEKSAQVKWSIVAQDPLETGLRKILNAGHTIGHAIESWFLAQNRPILHGEAVAAGLIAEAFISRDMGLLSADSCRRITHYLVQVYGKLQWQPHESEHIALLCYQDKKNKGNKVRMALLKEIGQAVWDYEVAPERITAALEEYRQG